MTLRCLYRSALALALAPCAPFMPRCTASAQDSAAIGPDARYASVARALTAFIDREMRDKRIPALSVALVDDQRIVWSRGFGWEDSAAARPASSRTVYRVGSVSKLFTDIGIMQLVERGEVDLDAPLGRYLPSFSPRTTSRVPITLRQLMSHHSGLVREPPVGNYFDASGASLSDMVASLNRTSIVYAPGTRQKYSNAAIGVLGYLLESKAKIPFATHLQRAVLQPLDMRSAAFLPESSLVRRLAPGVMWTYHGREFPAPNFQLGMAPAGSMYATMPDLARFISALFAGGVGANGRVLQQRTLERMWEPQYAAKGAREGVGLGFMVGSIDDIRIVSHGGAIYGFATELAAAPDEKIGVVVSAAKDGMNALTSRIATEGIRLMRAAKGGMALPALESTSPVTSALARQVEGRWVEGSRVIEVVVRDSAPTLISPDLELRLSLRRWLGDTLIADDGLSWGPKVWFKDGRLFVNGKAFRRVKTAQPLPAVPSGEWRGLIGEYGWDHSVLYITERDARLTALVEWFFEYPLTKIAKDTYAFPHHGLYAGERLVFTRGADGRATKVEAASVIFPRRTWIGEDGGIFRISPVRPVEELRATALASTPPRESGTFREQALTELVSLDSTIRLDVRYASDRNFLSVPVYTQARAFLQRPAAEALVRAHRALRRKGYGLLVHDGYRPWYVTKMFWDGTPPDKHQFVADPSSGSRHNRGCAVDLTLFDLRTGKPVLMPGGYDEMSDRSYPEYPGGTSRQRALREILRSAMEAEGFRVYDAEWWHFDYKDWRSYRIGNERFEDLGITR